MGDYLSPPPLSLDALSVTKYGDTFTCGTRFLLLAAQSYTCGCCCGNRDPLT